MMDESDAENYNGSSDKSRSFIPYKIWIHKIYHQPLHPLPPVALAARHQDFIGGATIALICLVQTLAHAAIATTKVIQGRPSWTGGPLGSPGCNRTAGCPIEYFHDMGENPCK